MESLDCAQNLILLLMLVALLLLTFCGTYSLSLSFDYSPLGASVEQSLMSRGSVSINPTSVELTYTNTTLQYLSGRLYNSEQLLLWNEANASDAAAFNCSFRFRIRPNPKFANTYPHGDGMAFLLLSPNSLELPDFSSGAWLGLFNSLNNGSSSNQIVAVEFDTYKNPDFLDPTENHIGINVNNIISKRVQPNLDFWLAQAASVSAWVDYSSAQGLLEVYATSDSNIKPSLPLLNYTINLTQYLPPSVYVGFSAGTGNASEYHTLLSWAFNSTARQDGKENHHKSAGLYAGLGAGTFIASAVAIACLGHTIARRKRRRRSGLLNMEGLPSGSASYGPRMFTYKELSVATRNFSQAQLLGRGGFGPVYKGTLWEDGGEVAVKCMDQKSSQGEKEFLAEVSIISRIRHRHLVQLKGWCQDNHRLLLVYEFLPKGSLNRHLFGKERALDWSSRFRVVCGLGSAVQYLHGECENVIVHRDIKSSNVMLDSKFDAKLGDFGLARQLREGAEGHATAAAGTLGYMAPECYYTGSATPESDMYSFGVLLLEVGCARPPADKSLPGEYQGNLLLWVWSLHTQGRLLQAADARLEGAFEDEQLRRVLTVGLACSHPDPEARPTAHRALEALHGRVPLPGLPTTKPTASYGPPISSSSMSVSAASPSAASPSSDTTHLSGR